MAWTTLFDVVCTRDDVAAVKPAPDLFLLAAERLGVRPQDCVVFEDSPNGLRAARAAGMWAVAVPNLLTQPLELPVTRPCARIPGRADARRSARRAAAIRRPAVAAMQ